MRVALCLSGQPRCGLKTFANIKKFIIDPNNADVFIHMNYDPNIRYIEKGHMNNGECELPENIDSKVIELYSPKAFKIELPKNFKNPNIKLPSKAVENRIRMNHHVTLSKEQHEQYCIKQMYSQYYSIYKCNELKELYANENNFVYDYVIRLRFDAVPHKPIICSSLDNMYVYSQQYPLPDNLRNDWMIIGNNAVMNVISSMFLNYEYLNSFRYFKKTERLENTLEPSDERGGIFEHAIRDLLTLYKIPTQTFDVGLTLIYK